MREKLTLRECGIVNRLVFKEKNEKNVLFFCLFIVHGACATLISNVFDSANASI